MAKRIAIFIHEIPARECENQEKSFRTELSEVMNPAFLLNLGLSGFLASSE
jgi:hypothetical protein